MIVLRQMYLLVLSQTIEKYLYTVYCANKCFRKTHGHLVELSQQGDGNRPPLLLGAAHGGVQEAVEGGGELARLGNHYKLY